MLYLPFFCALFFFINIAVFCMHLHVIFASKAIFMLHTFQLFQLVQLSCEKYHLSCNGEVVSLNPWFPTGGLQLHESGGLEATKVHTEL